MRYSCVENLQPTRQDCLVADFEEHVRRLADENHAGRGGVGRLEMPQIRGLRVLHLDQVKIEIPERFIRYTGPLIFTSVRLPVKAIASR